MTPIQSKDILLRMAANFPGLVDGETDVNGGDLVEWISNEFWQFTADNKPELVNRAKNGSPE